MKNKGKKVRIYQSLLVLVTLLFVFAACGEKSASDSASANAGSDQKQTDLKEVTIGYPSGGSDWPQGVAGEAKYYNYIDEYLEPLGYKAKFESFVGAAPALHEALASNSLDYVIYAGMAGVLGKSKGIDTTLLGITSYNVLWKLVVREDSGINTLADLKGKKIAYMRGASPHMYLIKVLEDGGLTFDDIEPINATIPDGISSLAAGNIDAAVVSAGQEAELVNSGQAKVLHFALPDGFSEYAEPGVLIGRTQAVQDNPDVAVAIYKGLLKAKAKIGEDVEAFYKLSADQSGYDINVIKETGSEDVDKIYPLNLDTQYLDALKDIQTFLLKNKLIEQKVDFDAWVNDEIQAQAIKEFK